MVDPLSGDRIDLLGGIADQREAGSADRRASRVTKRRDGDARPVPEGRLLRKPRVATLQHREDTVPKRATRESPRRAHDPRRRVVRPRKDPHVPGHVMEKLDVEVLLLDSIYVEPASGPRLGSARSAPKKRTTHDAGRAVGTDHSIKALPVPFRSNPRAVRLHADLPNALSPVGRSRAISTLEERPIEHTTGEDEDRLRKGNTKKSSFRGADLDRSHGTPERL
jgi:hypothetical protein